MISSVHHGVVILKKPGLSIPPGDMTAPALISQYDGCDSLARENKVVQV